MTPDELKDAPTRPVTLDSLGWPMDMAPTEPGDAILAWVPPNFCVVYRIGPDPRRWLEPGGGIVEPSRWWPLPDRAGLPGWPL